MKLAWIPTITAILILPVSTCGISFQQPRDAAQIRIDAHQPGLTKEKATAIYAKVRDLIFNSDEPASQKCSDAEMALRLIASYEPAAVDSLIGDLKQAKWLSSSSPVNRAAVFLTYSQFLLANHRVKEAKTELDRIAAEHVPDSKIVVYTAILQAQTAQQASDADAELDAVKVLEAHYRDGNLPMWMRQDALGVVIQTHCIVDGISDEQKIKFKKEGLRLASNGQSDSAWLLRVISESIDLLPLSDTAFNDLWRQISAKLKGRPDDVAWYAIRIEMTKHKTDIISQLVAQRDIIAAHPIANSRSLVFVNLRLAQAILQLPRLDKLFPGKEGANEEAVLVEAARKCLSTFGEAKAIQLIPEAYQGLWIAYYARTHQPAKILEAYQSIDSERPDIRITLLAYLEETNPELVQRDWSKGMSKFAENTRTLALKNPDDALSYVSGWNVLWSMFESIPESGYAEAFLEGYAKATGIVKNIPFRRKLEDPEETRRLYGEVNLDAIQAKIPPDTSMLVYIRFDKPDSDENEARYGGFLVNRTGPVRFKDLGDAKVIDHELGIWNGSLRNPTEEAPPSDDPREMGEKLYNLLVEPLVRGHLPGKILVVPDGAIGNVSFAAFVTPRSRWLVQDCTITYLGAMRDILSISPISRRNSKALTATTFTDRNHPPLSGPNLSLQALSELGNVKRSSFSRTECGALNNPRYLFVFTHGKFEDKLAMTPLKIANASFLIAPATPHDQEVSAVEVAKWKLRGTSLAILAACESGKSESLAGEGMGGLRRALYIAGANQVISSLQTTWGVGASKAPGDFLLSQVISGIGKGMTPEESLRQAQIGMIESKDKEKRAPYLWANFICEGL